MLSPRTWGLFWQMVLYLCIVMGWTDWPQPEQSWEPRAFAVHDNGAVVGCHLLWPSGFK